MAMPLYSRCDVDLLVICAEAGLSLDHAIEQVARVLLHNVRWHSARIAVGDQSTPVEFFWLNLRSEKKAALALEQISAVAWLRAVHNVEILAFIGEGFLSAALTDSVDRVVEAANLRRFLANALDKKLMAKTKRTLFLFHRLRENAPEPN